MPSALAAAVLLPAHCRRTRLARFLFSSLDSNRECFGYRCSDKARPKANISVSHEGDMDTPRPRIDRRSMAMRSSRMLPSQSFSKKAAITLPVTLEMAHSYFRLNSSRNSLIRRGMSSRRLTKQLSNWWLHPSRIGKPEARTYNSTSPWRFWVPRMQR